MNTNKQLTKGNTMKKIAMVISLLTVIATSANATTYWTQSNIFGGQNLYSSSNGMLGWTQPNILGGSNFYTTW
jgi:hypothetical protein